MVAIYDPHTARRTSLAPVQDYDHPAYCEGWDAAQSSTYIARDGERFLHLKEWENPYDAYTDSEAFSQWRQGYWAAIEDGERLAWDDEDEDDDLEDEDDELDRLRSENASLNRHIDFCAGRLCNAMHIKLTTLGKAIDIAIERMSECPHPSNPIS